MIKTILMIPVVLIEGQYRRIQRRSTENRTRRYGVTVSLDQWGTPTRSSMSRTLTVWLGKTELKYRVEPKCEAAVSDQAKRLVAILDGVDSHPNTEPETDGSYASYYMCQIVDYDTQKETLSTGTWVSE